MPGVEIKAAIKALLQTQFVTASGGDGRLKHVNTQYPRLSDEIGINDLPQVTIFGDHEPETQIGGGRAAASVGQKVIPWNMILHCKTLLDQPIDEGDAWDQLLDDIEALLRANANSGLGTSSTGTSTKIKSAFAISRRTYPPDREQMRNAYNSFITMKVEEWVNA